MPSSPNETYPAVVDHKLFLAYDHRFPYFRPSNVQILVSLSRALLPYFWQSPRLLHSLLSDDVASWYVASQDSLPLEL